MLRLLTVSESSFRKHNSKLMELCNPLKFMLEKIPNQTPAIINCHKLYAKILSRYLRLRLRIYAKLINSAKRQEKQFSGKSAARFSSVI